jgi:hypothetical protein
VPDRWGSAPAGEPADEHAAGAELVAVFAAVGAGFDAGGHVTQRRSFFARSAVRARAPESRERKHMAQAPLVPTGEPTAPVGARLPLSRRARVEQRAAAQGVSLSDYVRLAIEEKLQADEDAEQGVMAAAS